jgi:hypothetical protein
VSFIPEQLFSSGDFRFHLTLRTCDPEMFFRSKDETGGICAERKRWLAADPERYIAVAPEGEAVVDEFVEACRGWNVAEVENISAALNPHRKLVALGGNLEPDLLFLSPDAEGLFRLRAGGLCFPTGWDLREKMGHTLDWIHGVVPGLNSVLASPIQNFLSRLKPGVAFLRDNWGISCTDALNLHPSRNVPPPAPQATLSQLWLRVENQALVALPKTRGVVFGIRISLLRLDALIAQAELREGLRRALRTMPDEVVRYKRLEAVRSELCERLGST